MPRYLTMGCIIVYVLSRKNVHLSIFIVLRSERFRIVKYVQVNKTCYNIMTLIATMTVFPKFSVFLNKTKRKMTGPVLLSVNGTDACTEVAIKCK